MSGTNWDAEYDAANKQSRDFVDDDDEPVASAQPTSALSELRKHEGLPYVLRLLRGEHEWLTVHYPSDTVATDALAKLLAILEASDE
jgi:predicted DNA binding protein